MKTQGKVGRILLISERELDKTCIELFRRQRIIALYMIGYARCRE